MPKQGGSLMQPQKHLLFPIPLQAVDSDSMLEQNPGY